MSSGRGLRGSGSNTKDKGLSEVSGEVARELTTTPVVKNSRADVNLIERVDVVTGAHTEYTAGAEKRIRGAAGESCDSGGGLDDKSPTEGGVSTAVGESAEDQVGSGSGDGAVGLPARNNIGIPVSPVEKTTKKSSKRTQQQQQQQQQQTQSLSPAAMATLERLGLQRQQQRSVEADATMEHLAAQIKELQVTVDQQKDHIEELKAQLVIAQKSTPFKARIAFEEDVKARLMELEKRTRELDCEESNIRLQNLAQQLANFIKKSETIWASQASERSSLITRVQDMVDGLDGDFDSTAQRLKVGLLAKNSVQQRIRQDPDGFWQFIHDSRSWGRTEEELAEDCEALALCVLPSSIYDIGFSRVSLSSKRAKEAYVQKLTLQSTTFDHCDILDVLWRYRIKKNMLRDEALEEESDMHRDLTQLISEHCKFIGIRPSK